MVRPNTVIDNYRLASRLGANSYGEVWAARESITERLVRINFLSGGDDYQVTRFTRAISLLAQLNHVAIVAHTGHGFHQHLPYLATEHVQGPTLATLMTNGGRMDELRVLHIAAQVADGLNHASRTADMIHRNLGPETILVDLASMEEDQDRIRIKIIDFGHALGRRLVDRYDLELVAEEAEFQRAAQKEIVGTPLTMAPEQVQGGRLTAATDMYALGVTMYLLLTGSPPFTGSDDELRNAHVRTAPLDLLQVVPALNSGTASLVKRLLAKNADARFPDWASCLSRIQQLVSQVESSRPARVAPGTGKQTRRATVTYQNTPRGGAVAGGVAGGDPKPLEAPPSGIQDERYFFKALGERLKSNQATPGAVASAISASDRESAPLVDDGLTAEQRAAVWAFLFRNPAIRDASVNLAAAENPFPDGDPNESEIPVPATEQAAAGEPFTESAAGESAGLSDEEQIIANIPAFADIFVNLDQSTTASAAHQTRQPSADEPRNPIQSPFWKMALENLRVAIIGKVNYQANVPASLSSRFTKKLRRLIASREDMLADVSDLLDKGTFDQAEELLNKLATTVRKDGPAGNDAWICLLRARMFALRGDFVTGLKWAQNAVSQRHPDPLALALVGLAHLQLRRVQTSIAIFDESAKAHPDSALGPLGQATILFLAGLNSKTDLAFHEASHRQPLAALTRLAALRCRANRDPEGEITFLKTLLTNTAADWELNERIQEIMKSSSTNQDGSDRL